MAKVTLETDGTRNLLVHFGSSRPYKVQASSESEIVTANSRYRVSKTWNFEEDGVQYRVQIQRAEYVETGGE